MTVHREDVELGIGDDAALLRVQGDSHLYAGVGLVVGEEATNASAAAAKLMARARAALPIGVQPKWMTLALTLPSPKRTWLKRFSCALAALATPTGIQLIGGDTTQGPFSLALYLHGTAPVDR